MTDDTLIIRPSSLSDWLDCPRRFAARHLRDMLASAGYTVGGRRAGHIGAHVGTGLHGAAAHTLIGRLQHGKDPSEGDAEAVGIAQMRARMEEDGVEWDDSTRDPNTAEKQLRRMVRAWRERIAPEIRPQLVEERLEVEVAAGIGMSGQLDIADTAGNGVCVRDNKTTKQRRSAHAQLGAYALLLHSHGWDVQGLRIDHIARAPLSAPQPTPETREVALRPAMEDAMEAVNQIGRAVEAFRARAADPRSPVSPISVFSANPSSSLCSSRWCPAWGTTACRAHVE